MYQTSGQNTYCRSAGLILDTADLVDIVLHQLGVVELEVSVHCTLPKKLVGEVVLVLTSLNHGEVLAVLGVKLVVAALHDGELADVVVDRLLAGRRALQQSDGVVWSVDIVQGCVRLPSARHYVLHQVHSGHRWLEKRGQVNFVAEGQVLHQLDVVVADEPGGGGGGWGAGRCCGSRGASSCSSPTLWSHSTP